MLDVSGRDPGAGGVDGDPPGRPPWNGYTTRAGSSFFRACSVVVVAARHGRLGADAADFASGHALAPRVDDDSHRVERVDCLCILSKLAGPSGRRCPPTDA